MLVITLVLLSSCSLKQMIKLAEEQELTVDPNPLELHGDSVTFKLSANIPVAMLKKGTKYTMKTSYKYGDKTLELKDIDIDSDNFQGTSDDAKINKTFSFLYNDAMKSGKLYLTGVASKKGTDKIKSTPELEIAVGIITTSRMVKDVYQVAYTEPGFNTKEELEKLPTIDFYFDKNKSILKTSEIEGENGEVLDQFIASKIATKEVTITGYHSPEGLEAINEDLAKERAKSVEDFYRERMERYDYANQAESINFVAKPVFQSWKTLKDALKYESHLTNKEEEKILKIIGTSGPSFREKELALQKLPFYKKLYKNIYPNLRRSETQILTIKKKKTEAEITLIAKDIIDGKADPSSLAEAEILFAANQTPILSEKEALYKAATKESDSWRAHVNLASTYIELAKTAIKENQRTSFINMAETHADLASKNAKGTNAIIQNNLGIIAMLKGDKEAAKSAFTKGKTVATGQISNQIKSSLASTQIADGRYADALNNLNGLNESAGEGTEFNKALAYTLSKDYPKAESTIKTYIKNHPKDAEGYYLQSIIYARTGNEVEMKKNYNKAIDLDSKYKDISLNDLEFKKYTGITESK